MYKYPYINYDVFLGIANHLGYCAYYVVEVKFSSGPESAPDVFGRTPSGLFPLYNLSVFVNDGGELVQPLTFSFGYSLSEAPSRIEVQHLRLNNVVVSLEDQTVVWDQEDTGFFSTLFFELWVYNSIQKDFQYQGHSVSLRLNMTDV